MPELKKSLGFPVNIAEKVFVIAPQPKPEIVKAEKKPVIDKSSPEYPTFIELKKRINKEFLEEYIGTILRPSLAFFKLPFAIFGIGPHHMQRAKAILNIINTRATCIEEIDGILQHEKSLLEGKTPTAYSLKLINNPQLSIMKNVPKYLYSSGYYKIISAWLDEVCELRTGFRQSIPLR